MFEAKACIGEIGVCSPGWLRRHRWSAQMTHTCSAGREIDARVHRVRKTHPRLAPETKPISTALTNDLTAPGEGPIQVYDRAVFTSWLA